MKRDKFDTILEQIAKKEHTTKAHVRQEMQKAMDLAMASPDPVIQARWARIPKAGEKLTLEEFVAYVSAQAYGNRK